MKHKYKTKGVCPWSITFDMEGNVVRNVEFEGGCNGNLKAICRVVDGMTVDQIETMFGGICCDSKKSSCSDQLSIAVRKAFESESKE